MFDARSLLESIMGGGRQQAPGQGGGGLGDILGQLQRQLGQQGQSGQGGQGGGGLGDILGQLQRQLGEQRGGQNDAAAPRASAERSNRGEGGDNALGDLMRNLFPDQGAGGQDRQSGGRQPMNQRTSQNDSGQGGLDDIIGQLQRHLGGGGSANERGRPDSYQDDDDSLSGRPSDRGGRPAGSQGGGLGGAQGGGGLFDVLGKVLSQATQGAREGAGRIGDATGASDALGRMTGGRSADDLLGQLKELIENNKLGAGVAAGGLGAAVLGTETGRAIAGSVARIGALALIGGLAYKALQNYQAGRPLITGADPVQPAPRGSGYEADAVDNDTAVLYLQAMLAAAAADGRLDEQEQARILSGLKQAGAENGAEEFIAEEFNNPAEPEALAEAVSTQEQAVQVYTAARLAIDPDTSAERQFLARLAAALNLDSALVAHIDANARGIA